jgi:transposase-like protein
MLQPPVVCPRCSSEYVKRVSRVGPGRLMSLFYIYPFRCQPCGRRFRILQWGVTYTRIEKEQGIRSKPGQRQPLYELGR